MHIGWQVLLLATSLYRPAVRQTDKHSLVGVVFGSPKVPGELSVVIGQISMQTLVGIYAKVGTGHEGIHNFVVFSP